MVVCLLASVQSFAAIRYVSTTGNDNNTGTSWGTAFATLQKALDVATSGDTIWVAKGRYIPTAQTISGNARSVTFKLKNGVAIYGGFAGTETTFNDRDVTLLHSTNRAILSGDLNNDDVATDATLTINKTDNAYRVISNVTADGINNTAILNGFTISGGVATATNTTGAGIYLQAASPVLQELVIRGNIANNGGGIYIIGTSALAVTPTLTGVVVEDNIATSTGGGVYCITNASPVMTNVRIVNNTAKGTASGNGAGGLYIINSPLGIFPVLTNVELSGNATGSKGGGLLIWGSSPVIRNIRISNNTAVNGAGVYITPNGSNTPYSSPVFTNALISNNTASSIGGGIFLDRNGNSIFINATIAGNAAALAAGLYDSANTSRIRNTILWNNTSTNGPGIRTVLGGNPVFSYSIVQGSNGSGSGWNSSYGTDSTSNYDADPMFTSPTSFAPITGSPAVNNGSDALYGNTISADTTIDGTLRKVGSSIDIGVYENQSITTPVTLLHFSAAAGNSKSVHLRWTVTAERLAAYRLERSTDGRSFTTIAVIAATGLPQYTYQDDVAALTARKLYYRLKLTDADGAYRYSPVAAADLTGSLRISVSPVPAVNFLYITNSTALNGTPAIITSAGGSVVHRFNLQGQTAIPVANWANGLYLLTTANGQTVKIIKH